MASAGKPGSEQELLSAMARQVASLHMEAKRLNRRLRNARAAIQSIEDELATLADEIEQRLTQFPRAQPR